MKALAITKSIGENEQGGQFVQEVSCECNFDQSEIFSWTIIKDEDGIPDYITMITKNGISLEVEYDERVLSNLAAEFRTRNVL